MNQRASPLVSVIVPVGRDADSLAECLEALVNQSYARKELTVVCDAESPRLLPEGMDGVRVILGSAGASPAQLVNRGMQATKGELRAVLMPHCVPTGENWLEGLIAPFEDQSVGAVVSRCTVPPRKGAPLGIRLMHAVSPPHIRSSSSEPTECELLSGRCDAFRAAAVRDAGGYHREGFGSPGEVVDLSVRIARTGHRIVLAPGAEVTYRDPAGRRSLGGALARALDYGRADALLARVHHLSWLSSNVFAAALLSLLLVPAGLVYLPAAVLLAALIFAWGWFLPLRLPLIRWEWPVAALNVAAYIAVLVLIRDDWARGWFPPRRWHPALIRQWFLLVAMSGSYLVLVFRAAALGMVRSVREERSALPAAAAVFFLAALWHLLRGLGYMAAWIRVRWLESGSESGAD